MWRLERTDSSMGGWGVRGAVAVATTVALISVVVPAHAAPVITSPAGGETITPGGRLYLESGRWYPPAGCASKVKVTIRDSAGDTRTLGRFTTRFSLFENQFPHFIYDRSVAVPAGMKPGAARMRATQTWGVKFPVINICIDLFTISATRTVNVEGAIGNDPPVITALSAGTTRTQGTMQPITWTASEPCAMTLTLVQSVGGVGVDIGPIVESHPGVEGANTYAWDSRFAGADLTTGNYDVEARCTDAQNSSSAPRFTTFRMEFRR
jgi:hypothetical protein